MQVAQFFFFGDIFLPSCGRRVGLWQKLGRMPCPELDTPSEPLEGGVSDGYASSWVMNGEPSLWPWPSCSTTPRHGTEGPGREEWSMRRTRGGGCRILHSSRRQAQSTSLWTTKRLCLPRALVEQRGDRATTVRFLASAVHGGLRRRPSSWLDLPAFFPTQPQLSRPVSSGHHISMEHRQRRKTSAVKLWHRQRRNSDTNASNEIFLKGKQK